MEEIFHLIKLAQGGDEGAKTRLIEENAPLIKSVIRRYKNKGTDYEDLFQLGCIGFLKAVKNFSFDYNVRFSTYAVPMIAGEVKRFLRDDGFIKVSRATKSLAVKINSFVEKYKQENQESPPIDMLAGEFGVEPFEVVFALDAIKTPVSLYEKGEGGDDESGQTLLDKIADKRSLDDGIDRIILKDMIRSLDARDKLIIVLRYFKDKTQSEVARVLGVSQVQVSRLESKIINRIKEEFNPNS
ncbi:MAG: SigB/SigF/SigG family RNA polymerase sigma factor [Firmicutes bacterium]|nr:SigB/SigF/SigG family RNA polymerase sigma factor [Bacillota bacterium]